MAGDQPWDRALGTPLPEKKRSRTHQRVPSRRHLLTGATVLVAVLAVLAAWLGFQYWPRQGRLASGGYNEDFSDMMEAKGSMLELPEGHSCDIHERKGDDVTCVPHATWQQLMVAKDQLNAVAGLRHQLVQSEQALAEARRLSAEAAKRSAAEMQTARASATDAQRSLHGCQKAEKRAREKEKAAVGEADQLMKEVAEMSMQSKACNGARKVAEQRLAGFESEAASQKEAAVKEEKAACSETAKRAEMLEGELANCRGKLAGLGEGCSKCWHMLDEAKDEVRRAQWVIGLAAAGVCGAILIAAYAYGSVMSRKVSHLKLEQEKLRCAAAEAKGGLRPRMGLRERSIGAR